MSTARVRFPLQVELGDRLHRFAIWGGEQLPDRLIAYDTETKLVESGNIPQLALATAYGEQSGGYFVHPADLPQFIRQHAQAYWCCHNAVFDFWVTAQALQGDPGSCRLWWDIAGGSRLVCTLLLDQLIRLADRDAEPVASDLAVVAEAYCGLQLQKNDPYRVRYGELIGLSPADWPTVDPGFWYYAAKDPIATLLVAKRQFQLARQLIEPHQEQLLPNAVRRFGPLTVYLQVQGAIALDYLTRSGVRIDLKKAGMLREEIAEKVELRQHELERLMGGELFKRYGPRSARAGQLQRTPSGVPRRNAKEIKQRLEQAAKKSGASIRPPRLKDGSCTDAVRYWSQHQHLDPVIRTYCDYAHSAKLVQFFKNLKQDRVHPHYRPLVRTGRTSCSNPNLQQLPRDSRFREMIVAPPGYWLLQIDYSVLELRTLAQICLRRYGRSTLAELFKQGVDPHRYTAALLLGQTQEQFEQLPPEEQKRYRQRAKACFHSDVEVLTPKGWKRVSDLSLDDKVAQFWPESGLVEFVKPLALTTRDQQPLVRVHNESIDLRVTPDHRMLGYRASGSPVVCHPAQMNSVLRGFWNAGRKVSGIAAGNLNEQLVRQVVCIQADGSVSASGRRVRFGFTRERKIDRFPQLFPDAQQASHGAMATGFAVDWRSAYDLLLTKDKRFNTKRLLELPLRLREAFLDELRHWDSHIRKGNRSFSYSTTVKHNADAVAAVCAITGWKASIGCRTGNDQRQDCYEVRIKMRSKSRSGAIQIDPLPDRHTVHCLSLPSSFVIVRDNNKTVCVGQCNFGVPGGLGAASLVSYAKHSYGVDLTIGQAKQFRRQLITCVYPELQAYLREDPHLALADHLQTTIVETRRAFGNRDRLEHASRIVAGYDATSAGDAYATELVEHVWRCLQQLNRNPQLTAALHAKQPSVSLMRRIFWGSAATISGRLRGHVSFTQRANTPFQGLAADGNKLALFRLLRAGYRVCAFVHDEMLVLIPDGADFDMAVMQVEQILCEAMQEFTPDIPIATECLLADRWYKDAPEQPRDVEERIIPYRAPSRDI